MSSERLSISLTGKKVSFTEEYIRNHPEVDSPGQVIERALSLLALTTQFTEGQTLAVVDQTGNVVSTVNVPWLKRSDQIDLPTF
jgi:hypothetical protein